MLWLQSTTDVLQHTGKPEEIPLSFCSSMLVFTAYSGPLRYSLSYSQTGGWVGTSCSPDQRDLEKDFSSRSSRQSLPRISLTHSTPTSENSLSYAYALLRAQDSNTVIVQLSPSPTQPRDIQKKRSSIVSVQYLQWSPAN